MMADEVSVMLAEGEGQRSEFKKSFAEENDGIRTLCAFANAEGGTVLFGVADEGQVLGLDLGQNTIENFVNKLRRETDPPLSPTVDRIVGEGRSVVAATVREHQSGELFYAFRTPLIRVGKTNQVMSSEEQRTRLLTLPSRPSSVAASDQENSARMVRLNHIAELNRRTADLDAQRVQQGKDEIMRSYLYATVPRRVAAITQHPVTDNSGYWTIELWGMVDLADFNSSSHDWGPYFADTGRRLAAGEQDFLQKAIQEQVAKDSDAISRAAPEFQALERRIEELSEVAPGPDSMLAPIEVYVPFEKKFYRSMDWTEPTKLILGGGSINIFWSHRYAPSSCFAIFSSKAGTWHVVPDQQTGAAVTVAIGRSALYPDRVEIGVETTVRYEIKQSSAFAVIPLG